MRFSSLNLINKNNIEKLKLAWVFNSRDGNKGIQANPVVYEGLVYLPTPGNHIVCLNGANGKEIWRHKVEKGYQAAKRGLLVWKDTKNDILKLYFTNDDQLISLNAKTGKVVKSFGKNGIIKIGSSPIPPVIIDNQLVVATFRPSIESYDVESGKLNWKYYLREKNKKDFPLILTTSRVLQHYNAATMTKRTKNIKIVDEDVLLIHPKDAKSRELNTGDIARLYSGRGEVSLKVDVTEKVKEGIVFTTFHFPEHMVNMVTGHGKDEETMCAEYKVSAVEVQKISNQFKTEVVAEKDQAEVTPA